MKSRKERSRSDIIQAAHGAYCDSTLKLVATYCSLVGDINMMKVKEG